MSDAPKLLVKVTGDGSQFLDKTRVAMGLTHPGGADPVRAGVQRRPWLCCWSSLILDMAEDRFLECRFRQFPGSRPRGARPRTSIGLP